MSSRDTAVKLAKRYLRSADSSWSNGVAGAIAEFMYDADEDVSFGESANSLHAVTERGAIAVNLPQELTCFAYEDLAHCSDSWTQTIALALPETSSRLPANPVITALGADLDAIRPRDRDKQLFDLGLGSELARFCVRTGDSELTQTLNTLCGQSLSDQTPAVPTLLQRASPERIVISALGRIEVCTPIPQRGAHTEAGPHTHLLPHLFGTDRRVIPSGYAGVMHIYPPHPLHDKYGAAKPFDPARQRAFAEILEQAGIEDYLKAKRVLREAPDARRHDDSRWYDIARQIVKMQRLNPGNP